ncbi:MAG: AtpZ/AtpI family protein [Candidatus Eremiobacteraeota bacterium]|nr:AtpZ/AtpI family protein [Candidatus Eremiobacteraeota bacterium]MBC5828392.1 AtpZ/AtpI family protein [Candidatus Eremiobacteraeota bacterium]
MTNKTEERVGTPTDPSPRRPEAAPALRLAGAGATVVATIAVGLLVGVGAARYLNWPLAIPAGLILGFITGMVSLFRQLTRP